MSEAPCAETRRRSRFGLPLGLRFSLAELAVVLLYACLGAAALKSGGVLAFSFAQTTIVLALAFVVAAIVARGTVRAFAVGFLVGALGYGLPLFYFGASEFEPGAGQSPSSKILGPMWSTLDPLKHVTRSTGQVVPTHEVRSVWIGDPTGASGEFQQQWSYDGSPVEVVERPPRTDFMIAAHAFCAAATAWALGKLAAALYQRRERSDAVQSVALVDRNATP